ncbi:hypothetical protein [Alkalihalobacillus deserti]|uniref:hypothetical protein n=1 Tax=Alkalihalobacillus deserti TaxID=2879466 RepID=UPI001D151FCF|nr:hypothetical protein [Alkalihalobacillus deserti]
MKFSNKVFAAALVGTVAATAFVQTAPAEAASPTKGFVFETTEGKAVVSLDQLIVVITSPGHGLRDHIFEGSNLKVPYGFQDNADRFITLDAFINGLTSNAGKSVEEVFGLITNTVPTEESNQFLIPSVNNGQLVFTPVAGDQEEEPFKVVDIY